MRINDIFWFKGEKIRAGGGEDPLGRRRKWAGRKRERLVDNLEEIFEGGR